MKKQNKKSRLDQFISDPKKALWNLALPMMFGMSVQAIYMLVDTAFVGRWVGGTGLASLGYVFPYFFIIMGITFGLGSGSTTLIAQKIGAKEKLLAENIAKHTVFLGLFLGLLILIIGFKGGEKLILIQGADEKTLKLSLDYFYIMSGGSIFMVLSIFFRSILSGEGEMIFPMKILGIGTILNIILDPIFISKYQLAGAAIATVISQIIVTIIFIYYLLISRNNYLNINITEFQFNFSILKEIFRLGIPASLSMIIMSIGILLFNLILGSTEIVAAYQTAGRIEHLFFLPIISIATSLVTLVGMFYGAKRIELIKEIIIYGISRSVIISLSFSIFFWFTGGFFIPMFSDNSSIIEYSVTYFKIMAFAYPFITIGMTCSRIMQGLGHSKPMLILTLLRVIFISVSLAWILVNIFKYPPYFAWYGTLISCIITSLISLSWLKIILKRSINQINTI